MAKATSTGRKGRASAPEIVDEDPLGVNAAADTTAAGAIEGAGAALEADGDARDVAAAAIGGAAAGAAEVAAEAETDSSKGEEVTGDGTGQALPAVEDHITQYDRRLDRLSRIAEDAEFESGTLVGDITDFLVEQQKARPKPWSQMSSIEQRDFVANAEKVAQKVVRKLVIVMAEEDAISVHATLKGYSVDGEKFKIKAQANGDEDTAVQLWRLDQHEVIIISADAKRFSSRRKPVDILPDQPALSFADGAKEEIKSKPPGDDSDLAEGPPLEQTAYCEIVAAEFKAGAEDLDDETANSLAIGLWEKLETVDPGKARTAENAKMNALDEMANWDDADGTIAAPAVADEDPSQRINAEAGTVERVIGAPGEPVKWGVDRPATLDELREAATDHCFRCNLKTGMIERIPEARADDSWDDVRAATPDELAAERERVADFPA